MTEYIELTAETVEESEEEQSEKKQPITTHQGIKTSAAFYRKYYKLVKDLEERKKLWHGRVKEAVKTLGLPEGKDTDKVKISTRKLSTKGWTQWKLLQDRAETDETIKPLVAQVEKLYMTEWDIFRSIAEGNPALMAIVDSVEAEHDNLPTTVHTIVITDNEVKE